MSTSGARRGRRSFICGPPDNGCWLYGTKVDGKHMWETGAPGPWEHGQGPLCMVCGLPRGTYETEQTTETQR